MIHWALAVLAFVAGSLVGFLAAGLLAAAARREAVPDGNKQESTPPSGGTPKYRAEQTTRERTEANNDEDSGTTKDYD